MLMTKAWEKLRYTRLFLVYGALVLRTKIEMKGLGLGS